MARERIISIDKRIEKAKENVHRTKEKYDAAVEELYLLQEKKKEIHSGALIEAVMQSNRSYEEIMTFLTECSSERSNNEE